MGITQAVPWSIADLVYAKACDVYNAASDRNREALRKLREAEQALATSIADLVYAKACDVYNAASDRNREALRKLREAEQALATASDELEDADRRLRDAQAGASRGPGGVFIGTRREQLDAEASAAAQRTRWDNLRGYLSDCEGGTRDLREKHPEGVINAVLSGQLEMLAAIASFMDGQQDGTVTRG